MIHNFFSGLFAVTLALLIPMNAALAQHEGDVHFAYEGGKIVILDGEPSFKYGHRYFEGGFGFGGLFDRFTSDPGFETFGEFPIGAGDIIRFDLHTGHHGHYLNFFDPELGQISSAHDHSINILKGPSNNPILNVDVLAETFEVNNHPTFGFGLIGAAGSTGYFHQHANFQLSSSAPVGAYGFLMSLNTDATGIGNSDPFWMIFNYGMDEPGFHNAISAFTAVPEPSSLLALAGIAAIGCLSRRRTQV